MLPFVAVFAAVKLVAVLTTAQEVVLAELQERVALCPDVILAALEVNETVGVTEVDVTVTDTDSVAEPPVPVQVIL